jgi:hypothetical protein
MNSLRKFWQAAWGRKTPRTDIDGALASPSHAVAIFEHRNGGSDCTKMPLRALISSVLAFYQECPMSGLADENGDMLLFQYGVYDWGEGPFFEIDLTRQFIEIRRDEEDDILSQFHVTRFFSPTEGLIKLGSGEKWCKHRSELPAFRDWVIAQPALGAAEKLPPAKTAVDFELV